MKIPLFVIFGILGLVFFLWGGYMHEEVHKQIYKSYGIESKIGIDFPDLIITPEKNCEQNTCELAHDINEIVTYNLEMFYLMIFSGIMIGIMSMELKNVIGIENDPRRN